MKAVMSKPDVHWQRQIMVRDTACGIPISSRPVMDPDKKKVTCEACKKKFR